MDRKKQREKNEPKDITSTKVLTEAVKLITEIDALKGRNVTVLDLPGSHLSTNMDKEVHVVFRGTLAELVVAADPALYQQFVAYVTGQAVMYIWMQKALYLCLKIHSCSARS